MNTSKPPETPKASDRATSTEKPSPELSAARVLTVFAKNATATEIVEALQKLAREHSQRS